MSLDATRLGIAINAAMVANGAAPLPATLAWSNAIAAAIITEITTNAVVPAATIIAPAGGGPCTGAGTVT